MTTEAAFPAYDRTFPNVGKGLDVLWRHFSRLAFLYSSSLIQWVQSQRFVAQLLKAPCLLAQQRVRCKAALIRKSGSVSVTNSSPSRRIFPPFVMQTSP